MTDAHEKTPKSEAGQREEEILGFWNEHDIFHKSVEKDAPQGEFVFYDGPPFATGLPHYGHILASTIKDVIPRYKTMRGFRVRRKWGWDCHGLPLENIIESRLNLATKKDIENYGVERFNEAARDAVLEYADDWRKIIPRMGRWVDMDDDYKTMDPSYTESVWWAFKQLHEKGLVHEGFKSMHLCPRCGTTLSNFEVNQGYEDIKDIAVTVALPLLDEKGNETDESLLVWTTTPWTLPGNMAAAVHEDYEYVKVRVVEGVSTYIVAKQRAAVVLADHEYEIVETINGADLVGRSYAPPFAYHQNRDFDGKENAWKIYHAPYVELTEGTGAVHLAPAYGEEDMELAKAEGIPIAHHVGEDGRFLPFVTDFVGMLAKPKDDTDAGVTHLDADIAVLKHLQEVGKIFKKENITHSYPHCWRCDTPLLNYATTSWFVNVPKIKDRLVSENEKVHWVPEHVGKNRFGNWLEGAREWAISRQRYWGAPLPIWKNPQTEEYKVVGSHDDLMRLVPRSGNTYLLMRHGEAEANVAHRVSGDIHEDNPVTEVGKEEVRKTAQELKARGVDHIIASPFQRTRETVAILKEELGLTDEQIIFDDRLGEIQTGKYHGKDISEYHAFLDTASSGWSQRTPEGGESWNDVKRRVGSCLYDLEAMNKGKTVLVISHNSPLRMLGVVAHGGRLEDGAFDHDAEGTQFHTAEVRELSFAPLPHNRDYELDYHRPYIDEITLVDTDGTKLVRVPDVFDCWFESGSMPYAGAHYPFENTDTFNPNQGWFKKAKGYPADFIAEGLDQTRGWFYSLIVLGTALFGRSPYKNVIVNGLVLAEDGKKMSKRLQNYPDPMRVANEYGADTMRFYLLSSPVIKGEDLHFSEKELAELARKNIGRLHNVLSFYELYRDDAVAPSADSPHVLDRWIVARLAETASKCADGFEQYELDRATRPLTELIDDLSVWYVRRSRDRLKGENTEDKTHALATLRYALHTLARIMAPAMPLYAEYLYRQVREAQDPESVHLDTWPRTRHIDDNVIADMERVRELVTRGLEARADAGIKVRQPLARLSVRASIDDLSPELISLVADEVNVKEVVSDTTLSEECVVDTAISEALRVEGVAREVMRAVQGMRKKENLNPDDTVVLTIATDTQGQTMLEQHLDLIKKTVGAREVVFANTDGESLDVDGVSYTLSIRR